jgi:hypothetical protein
MPLFQRSLRPRTAPADAPASWLGRLGWLPWIAVGLGLEIFGRWSPGDGWDLLGALALAAVGTSAWSRWNHHLLRWWHLDGSGRWERFAAPWRVVYGFDLRGWPALPEALPMRWAWALAALSAGGFALLLGSDLWPGPWRSGLQQVSGLLLLCWTAVMGAGVLALGGFAALGAYQFAADQWRRDQPLVRAALVLAAVTWATAAWVLPAWGSLALLLGVALTNVWTTSLLGRDLRLIWRTGTDLDRGPRWGRFSTWEAGWVLALAVIVLAFGVLTHGDRWSGSGGDDTRWLSTAGIAASWLAAGTLGVTLLRHQIEVLFSRWHDPARPCLPRVALVGQAPHARKTCRSSWCTTANRSIPGCPRSGPSRSPSARRAIPNCTPTCADATRPSNGAPCAGVSRRCSPPPRSASSTRARASGSLRTCGSCSPCRATRTRTVSSPPASARPTARPSRARPARTCIAC